MKLVAVSSLCILLGGHLACSKPEPEPGDRGQQASAAVPSDSAGATGSAVASTGPGGSVQPKPATIDARWWPAVSKGDQATIRELLKSGVPVDATDEESRAGLALAAYEGHTQAVQLLLTAGAAVNHTDDAGRTALMYAASGPFTATVQLLLQRGANPNVVDKVEGWTALMWAAAEGQLTTVEVLLENNADRGIIDKDGDTAKVFAIKNGHVKVAERL
ncbi:MAG: hypothetical protein RJA70_2102 [Pseudomonadota bacterium]